MTTGTRSPPFADQGALAVFNPGTTGLGGPLGELFRRLGNCVSVPGSRFAANDRPSPRHLDRWSCQPTDRAAATVPCATSKRPTFMIRIAVLWRR